MFKVHFAEHKNVCKCDMSLDVFADDSRAHDLWTIFVGGLSSVKKHESYGLSTGCSPTIAQLHWSCPLFFYRVIAPRSDWPAPDTPVSR